MKLAIKGHLTRGKEVIELLEMLGGENRFQREGNNKDRFYYIDKNRHIQTTCGALSYTLFDLEQFKEEFPYKVGDKVKYINNIFCISFARWDYEKNTVIYYIDADWSAGYVVEANDLQPYKEEAIEESANKTIFKDNAQSCDIMNDIIKKDMERIKIDIPEGYEFLGVDNNNKVVLTKIQPQYPKTYKECCVVLGLEDDETEIAVMGWSSDEAPVEKFMQLLRCRNAYRKIAGKQMGLGKPWEPDFANCTIPHYCIFINHTGDVVKECFYGSRCVFAFPTEEMRDAFYENFKDLTEQCKELL